MLVRVFIVALGLSLSACSVLDPLPPEEAIAKRAQQQADALVALDYENALTYVSPSFQNSPRAASYQARYAGASFWNAAEVRWVRCGEDPDPQRCEVRLWVYATFPRMGPFQNQRGDNDPTSLDSVWIKVDGKWYQYLD